MGLVDDMDLPPRRPTPLGRAQPDNARLDSRFRFGSAARPGSAAEKIFGTVHDPTALGLQPASFCPHGPAPSGAVGTTPSRASLYVGRSVPQPRARKGRRGASPLSQNRRLLLRCSGSAAPARRIALVGA